jgi:type II secretory pathway component GspD/PulD (secretin)
MIRRQSAMPDFELSQFFSYRQISVIDTIAYQPAGVIMEVTTRVNRGGPVILDMSQEVSDVDQTTNTNSERHTR